MMLLKEWDFREGRLVYGWNAKEVAADLRRAFKEHGIKAKITPRRYDVRVVLPTGLMEYKHTAARDLMLIYDTEPRLRTRKLSGMFDWSDDIERVKRDRGDWAVEGIVE